MFASHPTTFALSHDKLWRFDVAWRIEFSVSISLVSDYVRTFVHDKRWRFGVARRYELKLSVCLVSDYVRILHDKRWVFDAFLKSSTRFTRGQQ